MTAIIKLKIDKYLDFRHNDINLRLECYIVYRSLYLLYIVYTYILYE